MLEEAYCARAAIGIVINGVAASVITQNSILPAYTDARILGHEMNEPLDNGLRPAGLVELSATPLDGVQFITDHGATYDTGSAVHALTLYRSPLSGALVFGAATVHWVCETFCIYASWYTAVSNSLFFAFCQMWGLDGFHDDSSGMPDYVMNKYVASISFPFVTFGYRYDTRVGNDPSGPGEYFMFLFGFPHFLYVLCIGNHRPSCRAGNCQFVGGHVRSTLHFGGTPRGGVSFFGCCTTFLLHPRCSPRCTGKFSRHWYELVYMP